MSIDERVTVAALQLNSGEEVEENWERIMALCEQAAREGASLVVLPENCLYIGPDTKRSLDWDGEWQPRFAELVRELGIYLVAGSVPLSVDGSDKVGNTSIVLDPEGGELARYRKIHLFDVTVPGGNTYRESDYMVAGEETAAALMPFGPLGLSICYDLRFPEMFRTLTLEKHCRVIALPSDFTLETGKDHWRPLLQARAIENQVYMIAANQWGSKHGKRRSWGHSMIVDPWGTVLAQAPECECCVIATLDFDYQDGIRTNLPCLLHV
jgi:deaminated glutathione amidase